MSKRAGTVITPGRPDRRARRGRRAVRADPVLRRHHPGSRPGPVDPADQRQPGLLRAVRARPAGLAGPQRRRPRDRRWATATTPALLDTERESELIALLAAYPGVLAAAAELREPHRVARYLEDLASGYHKFYDSVRVLPMGDEPRRPTPPSPGCGCAPPPGRCWPTGWPCSASPPRSGCEGASGRTRGPASCTPTCPARAPPADLNALDPAVWPRGACRAAPAPAQPGRGRRPRSRRAVPAPR